MSTRRARVGHGASADPDRGAPAGPDAFGAAVDRVVRSIPPGEVATYGEVAAEAGFPGAARAVGTHLSRGEGDLPWWRVVTASGRLVPGHEREHARQLRAEGVVLRGDRVPMARR